MSSAVVDTSDRKLREVINDVLALAIAPADRADRADDTQAVEDAMDV